VDPKTAGGFNELAFWFVIGLLAASLVAVALPNDLGVWFVPAGIGVMALGYVAGGGHSLRPIRTSTPMPMSAKLARVEHDIRMYERNVNWNLMYGGFVLGSAIAVAGLVAYVM
jgi:hypothetical protein